jgi:transposase
MRSVFYLINQELISAGKSKLDVFKEEIIALLRNGSSKKFVANRYGSSQVNLYNWIKKNNIDVSSQKACV